MLKLRVGRTVKLNRKELVVRKGKDEAELVFFGDLHLGHPNCLLEQAKEMLDYCLNKNIYVLVMGDLVECGLTGSVGDSIYTQKLNPQAQMEDVIELLQPLADKGLIVGVHAGNHEMRIFKTSGINISKNIAGWLNVPFLHSACWNLFRVGKQNYSVYSMHGATGSKFIYTKIKAATDISHYFPFADIVAHGHVHDIASVAIERQYINMKDKQIAYFKQYVVITGHYLGYSLSYAQDKGMPPSKVGSPKVKLHRDKHDIHISE